MPARQFGIRTDTALHYCWILDQNLIVAISIPHPKLIGILGVPCDRRLRAVNLQTEAVLAPTGDLARGESPTRALAHAEDHRPEILRINRNFYVIRWTDCLS